MSWTKPSRAAFGIPFGVPTSESFLAEETPCLKVVDAENFSPAEQKSFTEAEVGTSLQPPRPTARDAVSSTVTARVAPRLIGLLEHGDQGRSASGSPYRKQRVHQRQHHAD